MIRQPYLYIYHSRVMSRRDRSWRVWYFVTCVVVGLLVGVYGGRG